MADRTVSVAVKARVDAYVAAMDRAAKSTKAFTQQSNRDLVELGSKLQGIGAKATIGLTAPLALLAKQAVGFASDATENLNRATVVFGDNADAIVEWSQNSVRSMGLARHEAQGAASTFGMMFDGLGLADDAAIGMSTSLVQLAADFASIHNADISDVIQAQTAAFNGEYDSLQRFVPTIRQAAVDQRALADSGKASTEQLTVQERALATYRIIMESAGAAAGDFARTSEDAANATRIASAAYKDAMAELGENLLPIVAKGALTFADLVQQVGRLPEAAQSVILGFGGLAAAAGPAILVSGSLLKNIQLIAREAPRLGTALSVGIPLLAVGAAAYAEWAGAKAEAKAVTDDLVAALQQEAAGVENATRAAVLRNLEERGLLETAAAAGIATNDLVDAVMGEEEALRRVVRQIDEANGVSGEQAVQLYGLSVLFGEAQEKADRLAAAEGALGIATDVLGSKAAGAGAELVDFGGKLDAIYASAFSVDQASDQLTSKLLDFADSVVAAKAGGDQFATSLDASTIEGLRNRDMLLGLVDASFAVLSGMDALGASEDEVAARATAMRAEMLNTLTQLGFNETAVRGYVDVLLQIPGAVRTDVDVDVDQAMVALEAYLRRLAAIPSMIASVVTLEERHDAARFRNLRSITGTVNPSTLGAALPDILAGRGPASQAVAAGGGGVNAYAAPLP